MSYVGDIRLGDTIDVKFCTVSTTGAPTTLAGSPAISAYPSNSTTELTAGITLTVDFDARTGLHNVRVVATSGNGYATATDYALVITAGTVGGTSVVGYVIGEFSIEKRSALMPTTAARTLVVDAAGLADANVVKVGPTGSGTAQTARDIGASVLLSAGTGTGQLDFASGVVKANLVQILATALTETAGQIAAAFKKWFDVAAPSGTVNSIPNATAGTAGGLFIAGTNAATTITTSLTTTFTGNLTGSVASVTGAVGSVTGAVGSVTGAVGSVTGNVGGNVTGSVGSVASGGISEASFATTAGTVSPLGIIDQGTAQSATGTTLVLRAAAAFADNELVGARVLITGGSAGVGQSRLISANVGATDTITVATWTTTPTGTITYKIFSDTASTGSGLDAAATRAALGMASANLDTQLSGIQSDTDNIQTRIPAALVSGRMDSSVGAMAANVMTAAAAASDLTTELQAGLSTLDAAGVRAAVGLASANLDTQLDALPTNAELATALAAADDAVLAAIAALNNLSQANIRSAIGLASANLDTQLADKTGYRLSATGVDDVLDDAVDGATTLRQSIRLWNAALGGKASGLATTTARYRDLADTKDRITATVDADGNRTAVARDLT